MREEASLNLGTKIYYKPEEIAEIKRAARVVESSVHPDTNKIIPIYMRMSSMVWSNFPLVLVILFTRN